MKENRWAIIGEVLGMRGEQCTGVACEGQSFEAQEKQQQNRAEEKTDVDFLFGWLVLLAFFLLRHAESARLREQRPQDYKPAELQCEQMYQVASRRYRNVLKPEKLRIFNVHNGFESGLSVHSIIVMKRVPKSNS